MLMGKLKGRSTLSVVRYQPALRVANDHDDLHSSIRYHLYFDLMLYIIIGGHLQGKRMTAEHIKVI